MSPSTPLTDSAAAAKGGAAGAAAAPASPPAESPAQMTRPTKPASLPTFSAACRAPTAATAVAVAGGRGVARHAVQLAGLLGHSAADDQLREGALQAGQHAVHVRQLEVTCVGLPAKQQQRQGLPAGAVCRQAQPAPQGIAVCFSVCRQRRSMQGRLVVKGRSGCAQAAVTCSSSQEVQAAAASLQLACLRH